ncbi:hypothetical protein [Streptomyces sp. SDr-06]|uniref:hypothetical protein n=1 Tax=Streptomyces sp. SDr-06 TaxID=2267702 RepID=UPI001CB8F30A|nr:hypothetical protein [Streptomyces sp. SDr-06]
MDDPDELRRLRALAVPLAWTDEWICPGPNGHLQAVGTDDAGRRQYLCHEEFRARQDAAKHAHVREVAQAPCCAAGCPGSSPPAASARTVCSHEVHGADLNDALRGLSGVEITAKASGRGTPRCWRRSGSRCPNPSHGAPGRPGTGPWCGWCAK